jgi:hypothetical protein
VRNRWIITVISLLLSWALQAQIQYRTIEVGALGGKMLDIYPNFPSRGLHRAVILSYSHLRDTQANRDFGRPTAGATLSFHDFGNAKVMGYGIGLQFEMTFAQRLTEKFYLIEKFRPGVVYSTKSFHYLDNPKNIVMGSSFAALMGATMGIRYSISKRLSTCLEASIWHSSNGHTALPNVGMNSPLAMISMRYVFSEDSVSVNHRGPGTNRFLSPWSLTIGGAYGINEAGGTNQPVNGPLYAKGLASIGVGYIFRRIHRVTLAMEGYYDNTYRLWNESQEWVKEDEFVQSSALMILLGHEFIYNRWALVINAGVNIYNPTLNRIVGDIEANTAPNKIKRWIHGRFAIRHYIWKPRKGRASLYAQAGIKSNFGQADFLEFGLGMTFKGSKKVCDKPLPSPSPL